MEYAFIGRAERGGATWKAIVLRVEAPSKTKYLPFYGPRLPKGDPLRRLGLGNLKTYVLIIAMAATYGIAFGSTDDNNQRCWVARKARSHGIEVALDGGE